MTAFARENASLSGNRLTSRPGDIDDVVKPGGRMLLSNAIWRLMRK
jgi:hypothetical protein